MKFKSQHYSTGLLWEGFKHHNLPEVATHVNVSPCAELSGSLWKWQVHRCGWGLWPGREDPRLQVRGVKPPKNFLFSLCCGPFTCGDVHAARGLDAFVLSPTSQLAETFIISRPKCKETEGEVLQADFNPKQKKKSQF